MQVAKCALAGSPGPFTGEWVAANGGGGSAKASLWEGGHRVVGVFNWPGHIAPGATSDSLASSTSRVRREA
jgi:arylsulfatase G